MSASEPRLKHEFDNAPEGDPPTETCDCGAEVPLRNTMVNDCPNPDCGASYNGCGQRLRSGGSRRLRLARERGRDPKVGRPGEGPVTNR